MHAYSLLRLRMKAAKLTPANIAQLLGVQVREFMAWEESMPIPEIYVPQVYALISELGKLLDAKLLPKSQNELAVEGLIALSKRCDDES